MLIGEFKSTFDQVLEKYQMQLSYNDQSFINRVFHDGLDQYVDRLRAISFEGHGRVVDAGCGYGQWSLALACLNYEVFSCDISEIRISFLKELSGAVNFPNLSFLQSKLNPLPYEDCSFDAVFCYGVVFLTPWRETLAEFRRVLKPGGVLYVNANGIGWYTFLWETEHNKTPDYDPRSLVSSVFLDTLKYDRTGVFEDGMSVIIEPETLQAELISSGFRVIDANCEGGVQLNASSEAPKPLMKGFHKGLAAVHEVIAMTPG